MVAADSDPRARRKQGADGAHGHAAPRLALACCLLLALIALLILAPESRRAESVEVIVAGAAIMAAIASAGVSRPVSMSASGVAVIGVACAVIALLVHASHAVTGNLFVMTVLALAIPVAVIVGLRHERTVTVQSVFGAIAVYLDVGLLFALLVSIAARTSDGPYFAQVAGDGSMSERVYFSYVTLATLGYGDLTPVTAMGRLLSVTESIIGSLYLVTAVSLVVSRVGMPRMRIPADGDDEG
ncbi:MAG TPA: potassium channel family protein [Gaiellales bacterium]|nr:potassium channel family protein [Gaiellales bacterium]